MTHHTRSRRQFMADAAIVAGALAVGSHLASAADEKRIHLASNQYPWGTFYGREGRNFEMDACLAEVASAGLDGFEPMIGGPQDIERFAPLLRKHKLEMRSLYVNSTMHTPADAAKSIEQVTAIAAAAKQVGAKIIVTNPNPIRWGGTESKDDAMLKTQAAALNELGAKLAAMGLVLGYHYHDPELRNAAREFHHMMVGTDPKCVSLCLDAHWTFRGSGNSAVAVFDVLKLYGPRIVEVHLRQSVKGIWTEEFTDGDIDYPALARYLLGIGVKPLLVLEQAVEGGSPKTMNAVEAHKRGSAYARKVFAGF